MTDRKTSPQVFRPDDPNLVIDEQLTEPRSAAADDLALLPAVPAGPAASRAGWRWGALFLAALGGLVTLAMGAWLHDLVVALLAREAWLGWLAAALLGLAALAGLMLIMREALALARLARLGALAREAARAIDQADKVLARNVIAGLDRLYAGRHDMAWARSRFDEHRGDIMDARELLTLAERELLVPLDVQARDAVASAVKRVSVLTAVSPAALLDMVLVAGANLRMLRRIATIYGARPAALGLIRLARMVVAHIVVTGGLAIGDDLVQQIVGQKLTARISARLGEGVFNGALTARIGIAALAVCRPLPHIETRAPRFRDLAGRALGISQDGKR